MFNISFLPSVLKRSIPFLIFSMSLLTFPGCKEDSTIMIKDLKTNTLVDPVGIDVPEPSLSWIMESDKLGDYQTAYRIIVASDEENLNNDTGDLWDTEKVKSDNSTKVKYNGKPLSSGDLAWWKVKVWNSDNQVSGWSPAARWSLGPLKTADWNAKWIGLDRAVGNDKPDIENRILSARYLRKDFTIEKQVKRAVAHIAGLGVYELYLNGQKAGDHVLSPVLSEYPKRTYYVSYDITGLLSNGENAVGVILGNGRYFSPRINEPTPTITYGFPKLLLQVSIEYTDGSRELLLSDESWKITTNGPIRENNEYDGEVYDARMELSGWSEYGFNDSDWMAVELVDSPSPEISAQMTEPMRITETIKPIGLANPSPGVYVFDMGQNMVGWTELTVQAEKGTVIRQKFAESLKEDGNLYLANIRGARVTDTYIAKGEGSKSYEPRFVFYGFRYVELTGYPGTPDLSTIIGKVIHDDVAWTGHFECSDTLINRIYKNATWGIRGNYRSIPTDCPQRDERQGWLGDRAAGSKGESYMFDIQNLYRKWLVDIFDAQKETGSISDVNPAYWPFYSDNVTWPGATVVLVNMIYEQYGDHEVIESSYQPLKKWIDHMVNSYMKDSIMPRDVYGDWCVPPIDPYLIHTKDPARLTPGDYLGTAFFYHYLTLMESFAEMLGKVEDKHYFSTLEGGMKRAFNRMFFNPEEQTYVNNSATSSVLALAFGLVPEEYEQKIFENLVHKIEVEHNSHITTGLIGQQYFNRVLTDYGRADLAFTVNTQLDYPGYGYMIMNGATTIWELWNGNTADPAMNSGNHVMLLGDFIIWLYEDLAGIQSDINEPGFKHIIMKPVILEKLDYVKAHHKSPYGMIKSEWHKKDGAFEWDITIPANTRATVYVPGEDEPRELGSGAYHFSSK